MHRAQDVNTGFQYAAKKVTPSVLASLIFFLVHHLVQEFALIAHSFFCRQISLMRFNSEEVGAWSALRSPRVVELFGVVREGPDVLLFMDLKSGE